MKGDVIPSSDDVLRHCNSTQYTDSDSEIRFIGEAFTPDSDGVSVTWVQYFDGQPAESLAKAEAIVRSTRRVRPSHRLAIINVGDIARCGRAEGVALSVEHDPIDDPPENPAHCLIKGIEADAATLREALALRARCADCGLRSLP
jgi:hypothetical protein